MLDAEDAEVSLQPWLLPAGSLQARAVGSWANVLQGNSDKEIGECFSRQVAAEVWWRPWDGQ